VIDFTFEEFDAEHLIAGARVTTRRRAHPGEMRLPVERRRVAPFEALGSSTPVDCFRLTRGVWSR